MSAAGYAAPLTLAFSARVVDIYESSPGVVELPFAVSVGDSINGTFSYDPPPVGRPGVQAYELTFDIANVVLRSQGYEIFVAPRQFGPVGDPVEPFDEVVVGCSLSGSGTQCSPGTVPGNASVRWRSFMDLIGDYPSLTGFGLPDDLSVWNQLTTRSLELTFTPLFLTGGVRIGAIAGPFTLVPEPHAATAIAGAGLFLLSVGLHRRRSVIAYLGVGKRFRTICLVVLPPFLSAACMSTAGYAAPLTLAFRARVTNVFESSPGAVDLPFAVSVGDSINGTLSYEPPPVGRPGVQAYELTFDIANVVLRSQGYEIFVALNQFGPVGEPLQLFDQIVVGCSLSDSGTQCNPGTVPGSINVGWRSFLSLGGDSPILSGYELPADPAVWNRFTSRSLQFSFTPLSLRGLLGVDAIVGSFTPVPEPDAVLAISESALLLLSVGLHRRRSVRA